MKTFLVVNPQSANGQTGRKWAELSAEIGRGLGEFGHTFCDRQMHAVDLTRDAIRKGYDCIVAVGGDGTINEVINGFFDADGKAINPGASLGLIPRGTGGDFRRTFGWKVDLHEALARLKTDATQPFDVGVVELVDHEGKPATRYFANIASFGVSGLVVKKVNESSKALGGKITFMLGSVRALIGYKDQPVRVTMDDRPAEEMAITTLAVANGKYFGGGMQVAPQADTRDGTFDITVWSGYGLTDFALKQGGIYSGAHVKWKGTRTFQCRELKADPVRPDAVVLLDVDGEQPGRLPCRMRILPSAIRLKV
ncbi:MAG TPA: diacylglycerol kinase family protein [Myxococcaceae bacterium]|nr:diacylglycerol kinase family protein [Myxococcaceae bacterium]